MKFKKTAAFLASAVILFSSGITAAVPIPSVYAAETVTEEKLPDWIPCDYESALNFRNTYGTTHIENGLLCIVFKEDRECERKSGTTDKPHYSFFTTEGVMEQLRDDIYGTESCRNDYEVIVFKPQSSGDFEVSLADNWVKSPSLEPQLNYIHCIDHRTFTVDADKNITETDIYSRLPDCQTEFKDFVKENGEVSVMDNYVIFCLESAAGTAYSWQTMMTGFGDHFELYDLYDCSRENEIQPAGGTQLMLEIFEAKKDGNVQIGFEYSQYVVAERPNEGIKKLLADCMILDDAQTVLLADDARVTFLDIDTDEPIELDAVKDTTLYYVNDSDEKVTIGEVASNPCIIRGKAGCFKNGGAFDIPEGYELTFEEGTGKPLYYTITKYDNGAVEVVYRLKKITVPETSKIKVTLIDSDTGELISEELLKDDTFIFMQQTKKDNYRNSPIVVKSNPCILDMELNAVYNKDYFYGYWNNHLADAPEIKLGDDGSLELTFSYPTCIEGDVNGDGIFSISDAVLLQRWLLGAPKAELKRWKHADLCKDDKLDSFDLCLMKQKLVDSVKLPVGVEINISGGVAGVHYRRSAYEDNGRFFVTRQDKNRKTSETVCEVTESEYREIMAVDYEYYVNLDKRAVPMEIYDALHYYSILTYADGSERELYASVSKATNLIDDMIDRHKS